MDNFTLIIKLHPKQQQPDGLWFFTTYDNRIIFTNNQTVKGFFKNYHTLTKTYRNNAYLEVTINHPTDKVFKL